MAWFKLNDSLNTLKGQISNVSNVVQEVFSEAIVDETSTESITKLEEATMKIDELTNLCSTQDNEIIALRRQILEFQQLRNSENVISSASTKSNADQNAPPIEDSWFWDPEPNTASSSSKDHSSKSGSGGDLTIIPLDNQRNINETIEKLRVVIDDKDQQLKKIKIENAILNEKINQLSIENREINSNIEELDRQHEVATGRLIEMKDEIEYKMTVLQKDLDETKNEKSKLNELLKDYNDLKCKYKNIEKSYLNGMEENLEMKNKIELLNHELEKTVNQKIDLISSFEEKEKEMIDKLGFVDIEKEKDQLCDVKNYQLQIDELNMRMKEFDDLKLKHQQVIDELDVSNENNIQITTELTQLKNVIDANKITITERDNEIAELKKKYDNLETSFNEFQEDTLFKEVERFNLERDKNSLTDQLSTSEAKYHNLLKQNDDLKSLQMDHKEKYILQEEFDNLKAKASENETKLIEENVVLQKEILDLQSCIKNENNPMNVINIEDLRNVIKRYVSYDGNLDANMISLEEFFRMIGDSFNTLDTIEKSLNEMTDELKTVKAEKKRVEHEKETIQADLHHYEIEVGELMKNNEVLLTEIEHLKSGKLETISEHNEDSIIILEKQLEDCSNLNQSLEDEYQQIRNRLEEVENLKNDLQRTVDNLMEELRKERDTTRDVTIKLENLDAERSNLLFEINELKSDDSLNMLEQTIVDKERSIEGLLQQLKTLNEEHSDLNAKLQSQSAEAKVNYEIELGELRKMVADKDELILKKEQDIAELISEIRSLNAKETEIVQDEQIDEHHRKEIEELLVKLSNSELEIKKTQEISDLKQNEVDDLIVKMSSVEEENHKLLKEIETLNEKLSDLCESNSNIQNIDSISMENVSLKVAVESLSKEKNELIGLITAKHHENVQYHSEIQRLSQLLTVEVEKHRECTNCFELSKQLNELQSNSQSIEKLNDQVSFLKEKSDILSQNLLTEQMNQKLIHQERLELIENKNNLLKDLERLQQHLLDVEENHTAEVVEMQRIINEMKVKMSNLEEDAKKSSNAYTSASIRANQHTETLQTQYQLLIQQRDELLVKLSAAEDKESRNEAALINLQCALEQFQNNKDRDVESVTYRLRTDMEVEKRKQVDLRNEIKSLNDQLLESKNGLLAAARITDQLESCQVANATLKTELRVSYDKIATIEKKLLETESCHADKIEKGLLKNLLIGYIVAPNNTDKLQILKLISSVLDFNQLETDKVGLNKTHTSWLNSLLTGTSGSPPDSENYNKQGLAEAFVQFLEKESQPTPNAVGSTSLLNIVQKPFRKLSTNESPTTVSSTIQSTQPSNTAGLEQPAAIQPILLTDSIMQNFAPPRNSSSILKDILNDS